MIARMERVEIICLRADLPEVIAFVQDEGVLHVEEVPLAVENAPDFLRRVHLTDKQREDLNFYEEIEHLLREVMPLVPGRPDPDAVAVTAQAIESGRFDDWPRKAKQWARELRSLTRRKVNIHDNIEMLENYRNILKTLEPVLRERNVTIGSGARAIVLEANAAKTVERLKNRFTKEIGPASSLIWEKSGRKSIVAVATYPVGQDRAVGNILHEEGVASVDAPDENLRSAPVDELLRRIDDNVAGQKRNLEQLNADLAQFANDHGAELTGISRNVNNRLAQLRVVNQFAQSQMIGVLEGWIPNDDLPAFRDRLAKRFSGNIEVTALGAEKLDPRRIPTLLKNRKFFKPFEVLLSIFRPPTYGAYDPTVLVAVAFILFYGFILGDVVYGIAVIICARYLGKKWGHIEAVKSASIVGCYMGVSAIVFGVLFGEYAGGLGAQLFHLQPLWFHRERRTSYLLELAILCGVVQVPLGLILGVWENYRHHHTRHAIEKLGMLLSLVAAGILIMGVLKVGFFTMVPVTIVGVTLFLLGVALLVKSMGFMSLIGILEILSTVGNVLSYARLMALGIASVAIADIANQSLRLNPFVGIPLALVIHLFNVGLGMFSPTIHSLRLNWVEFFSKFYTPEGKSYKPFKKEVTW